MGATNDSTFYVATDRITRNGDYAETWQKVVYKKPQHFQNYVYNYTIESVTVYCGAGGYASRINSITDYRTNGETAGSANSQGNWRTSVPDSVGELVNTLICSH
jgi:hypothetical protein